MLSKYQKGRAYEGTRARKSRFFSRSTSMLFLPFVRITSPVRLPTNSRSHAANAHSLVHVKICRVRAHVYARVCVRARTCLSSRFTRVRSHTYTYTTTPWCASTLDHPPVHPPRKLEVALATNARHSERSCRNLEKPFTTRESHNFPEMPRILSGRRKRSFRNKRLRQRG